MRRSAPLFAVVLVALLLPGVAGGATPAPRDFVGVTAEDVYVGNGDYRAANLETQASIGIGLIRQTFDWAQIETAPDTPSSHTQKTSASSGSCWDRSGGS